MATGAYTTGFYNYQSSGSRASAQVLLPHLFSLIGTPESILDVGCGVGTWLAEAQKLGVKEVLGLDGDYVARDQLQIAREDFRPSDLAESIDLKRRFDLVMSLEVAEHISSAESDIFVANLVRHGDVVMFGAAIPNQGGTHHVNEQWPSYWAPKFAAAGFELLDVVRGHLWAESRIDSWYRQNTLLFARPPQAKTISAAAKANRITAMPMLDVVHPAMFEMKLAEAKIPARLLAKLRELRSARRS